MNSPLDPPREIAELRNALEAVRKSEEQLRTMLDDIPTLVWRTTADGSAEFFNERWFEYTGLAPDVAYGSGWMAAFHPDDLESLSKKWTEIVASRKASEVEARFRRHDGQYRWHLMRSVPQFDESGRLVSWCGTNTDIEDRKEAEERLSQAFDRIKKSEEELRTIIDTIPALAWSSPEDGIGDFFSKRWLSYTGLSHEQASGTGWVSAIHPDDLEGLAASWTRIRASGREGSLEARLRRYDGAYRWFLFQAAPLRNPEGKDVVWYGTNTDIEDLKQAESELRRREADLRKAQAELAHVTRTTTMGELVASIAHEVNQPVGAMTLNANSCVRWLSQLKDESPELQEARKALQRIVQDGIRTGKIITRIRALVEKAESVREPLDINSIFHEVIALSKNEMEQRQVLLRLDLAVDLPPVLGDRVQLQQVMINLILNGIEAMTAVDGAARELVIGTQLDRGNVLASVRDTGVGFDADKAEQLFTAFHTSKRGGLGMGLSISRSIIDDHGGKLWATLNDGVGATFHFSLPVPSDR